MGTTCKRRSSIGVTIFHIGHVDVIDQGGRIVPGALDLPAVNPAVGSIETHFPVKSPRSRRNQIRLKTREAKWRMPSVRSTSSRIEKKANKSIGVGQKILTTLNSLAHTKDLLWYIILFLSIYAKRTYGAPILHQAFMPIAAYPPAWIPSHLNSRNNRIGITTRWVQARWGLWVSLSRSMAWFCGEKT